MNRIKLFASAILALAFTFSACNNLNDPNDPNDPDPALPFSVTFETDMGGFSTQNVAGDQVWEHSSQYKYAMMSGYVNQTNYANEDWLISPDIDLSDVTEAKLTFDHVARYFANITEEATVWVSEDYVSGLPATATWTQLTTPPFVNASSWTLESSGEISLTAWAGKVIRIAFKYVSTDTKAGTWEVKNFYVQEGEAQTEEPNTEGVDLCGDNTTAVTTLLEDFNEVVNNSDVDLPGWKVISVEGDRNWQGKVYTSGDITETYVQATAHNGTAANYEYWLVTPPLNLDAADSKNFSFSSSKAYWTATSSLKVYVLKCVDGVTTRTEITTANIAKESDTDHAFVPSGNIDLSSFSGTVYIGFQYIALGGAGNSTTFKIDDVMFSVTGTTVDVNSSAPTSAKVGEAYSYNITTNVVNPNGATTITATGLPSWATFTDNGDGTAGIVGTPDAVGSHAITVVAANNSVSATQEFTLVVTEPAAAGENLLVNPGFEDWTGDLPTGWDNATYNTGVVKETTIVRSGSNSVKHISTSSALKIQQEVEVTGGKTYNISYWFLDNSAKAKSRPWTYWVAGTSTLTDHATSLRPDSYSTDNAEWVKVEFTLTAPATATKLRFEVRSYRESTTLDGDPIYYDDFSVTEVQ